MQRTLIACALILVGCDGAGPVDVTTKTTGTTVNTDTTTGVSCEATVASVDPDTISYVPVDTVVTVHFSQALGPLGAFDVALQEMGGRSVPGTVEIATDGLSGTFTPDADLAFATGYNVNSRVCDDTVATVLYTPKPPVDPLSLTGRTYAIEVAQVGWVEPLLSTLPDLLTVDYILVQVRDADLSTDTVTAVAGTGDLSAATIVPNCPTAYDIPPADFTSNPTFPMGPTPLSLTAGSTMIEVENFELRGQFTSDLMAIEDVYFSGWVDPDLIAPGLGCSAAAATMLGNCVPCSIGAGECLLIAGMDIDATYRADVDMITDCGL